MQVSQRKAGILLNYINEAIRTITALVYTPIMLRLLGQSEYGLYQLVASVVSYLSLLSMGFGSAYVRYHSRYQVKGDETGVAQLNGMFMLIFCTMAVVCLICGGFMVTNADIVFGTGLTQSELATAKKLLAILIINMALTFPNSVFDCYVTAHERFVFQKLLRTVQSILNPFLTLPLLLMGYGSIAVVAVTTILTVGVFANNILYCRKKLNMTFSFRNLQFSLLKEMWLFTFFIFLNQIINQVNWSVDKFLLGRLSGLTAVAVYGVGAQVNTIYMDLSTSISNVFVPKVNQMVMRPNNRFDLTQLMIKIGRVQWGMLALVLTGFVVTGKQFIELWAGEGYSQTYYVVLLLIVPVTIPLIQNIGIEIQRAMNMHRARSVVYMCLAIGNVIISVLLIPYLGCVGAAAGTAISLLLGNGLFMNWYYHCRLGLNMIAFWRSILTTLPAVVLSGFIGMLLRYMIPDSGWPTLILFIVLYVPVYVVVMWCIGLKQEEKDQIKLIAGRLYR